MKIRCWQNDPACAKQAAALSEALGASVGKQIEPAKAVQLETPDEAGHSRRAFEPCLS